MDGTLSFRSKDKNPEWDPQQLKRNFPSALPVFSVDTEPEADELISVACTRGYGPNPRYGLPHILMSDIENMEPVGEHLNTWYERIKATA